MNRRLLVYGMCLLGILVIGIGATIAMAQSVTAPVPVEPVGPYTAVSGPVEQGDTAFWRLPYLPVGRYGVSGPVEQGDTGFKQVISSQESRLPGPRVR